jgi:hypothetical protein
MATQAMTLVERLRNPERKTDGLLDEAQTLVTMEEAAAELVRLQGLAGAVSAGPGFKEIRDHARAPRPGED